MVGRAPAAPPHRSSDDDGLSTLFAQEQTALMQRRRLARPSSHANATTSDSHVALPTVGLAISGGGVRSATFALGVLRGLAQQGLLTRLDFLSTVSGGGFVGAVLGRMVCQLGIEQTQAVLARADSAALDWLRRYGRYLTPAGARDLGMAVVTYLRAFVAIHFESLLACLPFAVLVMAPHLLQQGWDGFNPAGWQAWHTLWWPLALLLWLATAPGAMAAYWVARDPPDPDARRSRPSARDLLFLGVFALTVAAASGRALQSADWSDLLRGQAEVVQTLGVLIVLWSCLAGLVYTPLRLMFSDEPRALAVARLRNLFTRRLRLATLVTAAMAILGALDVLSWQLLEALQNNESWIQVGLGLGGGVVVLMRVLSQPLQRLAETSKENSLRDWRRKLFNLAGLCGLLVLVCAWLVAAQWLVFTARPLAAVTDYAPSVRALALLAVGCVWWLLSARNEQMANASSLHSFYRARLTRAYLAVGNPTRGLLDVLASRYRTSVTAVTPHDDLDMREYRPEDKGGPIHLVNACLNQTRDDSSGLYNADRKGTLVTVSARAIEVGAREAVALPAQRGAATTDLGADMGSLGRWVAISGAAASPGAGSYTSAGWALLMFFLGLRLGYWMRAPCGEQQGCHADVMRLWKWAVKPLMLWSEVSASFFGRARPWWYLSDGGHFENTGVYALLKRRLDFIIVADNGADAHYRFGDLENLIRKARIDFGAEIEFYTGEEAAQHFPSIRAEISVISPESMADNHSVRGVLLARVRYSPAADGTRAEATLLVVKPNLHDKLDLDLLAYAQRHPTFPHESTGDQSFDEAQWESYHRLGEDLGRAIQPDWLERLPGWTTLSAHPLTTGTGLRAAANALPPAPPPAPQKRRSARNTAVGATLGLGASGTLLLALWQFGDEVRQVRVTSQAEARQLFAEVSRELRDLDGTCPIVADHTTVQLLLLREMRQGSQLRPLERAGVTQLLQRVRQECSRPTLGPHTCLAHARRARVGVCAVVNKPPAVGTAFNYWHPAPAQITLASLLWTSPPTGQDTLASSSGEQKATTALSVTETSPHREAARPAPEKTTALASKSTSHASLAEACAVPGRSVQLYVQVYDEESRESATELVQLLRQDGGTSLQVAPAENVARSAQVSQRRRPVPWPQPTLIVHDAADKPCARSLSRTIRAALALQAYGDQDGVWLREIPKSLKPRPGVIELWLPPAQTGTDGAGVSGRFP